MQGTTLGPLPMQLAKPDENFQHVTTDYQYFDYTAQMLAVLRELLFRTELLSMAPPTCDPWLLLRDDFKHGCSLTVVVLRKSCFITSISYN